MNIETLNWDPLSTKTFSIHPDTLPEVRSSSEIYGKVRDGGILDGIRISGILGNQQASLVGQMCFKPGQAKKKHLSKWMVSAVQHWRNTCFIYSRSNHNCCL